MNYKDIILTANMNLLKSKLRTFLTISAVFMGALTLMLTTGVGAGLQSYVEKQVNAVGAKDVLVITPRVEDANPFSGEPQEYSDKRQQRTANRLGQPPTLQDKDIEAIRKSAGIKSVEPVYSVTPEYITAGNRKFLTNISQAADGLNQPLKLGRQVDVRSDKYEVTLPSVFVDLLGFESEQSAVGQYVILTFRDAAGERFAMTGTVVGIQDKTLITGNDVVANPALARAAYAKATAGLPDFQRQRYPAAFAKFDSNIQAVDLSSLKFRLRNAGYDARTLDDQLGIIKTIIKGITTFLKIFAGIALAAASFGIVNTLLMAVQERTREIGLMKALGMSSRKIFLLFSFEATLIGLWGALVALGAANVIGYLGSKVASRSIFKDFEGLQLFSLPIRSMLPIIGLIMVIAFIAAILPAMRASELDPIEALRYE